MDTYPGPVRAANMQNHRMNPCLAPVDQVPENILFVIPTIDILLHEQLLTFDRLTNELRPGSDRRIEKCMIEGELHGWIECKHPPRLSETVQTVFAHMSAHMYTRD
jgi:hypothetical protein